MGGRGPGNIRPQEHGVIVGGCGDSDACKERERTDWEESDGGGG